MKDKIFLDTNLLVYCFDASEPEKQNKALAILQDIIKCKNGQISTQSIQEIVNVTAKKKNYSNEAVSNIISFLLQISVYTVTQETIIHAKDIMYKYQLSFWDSLILAAANESGCTILYSEDLNAGQTIENVKIINPKCTSCNECSLARN